MALTSPAVSPLTSPTVSPTIPVLQSEVLPSGLISNLSAVSGVYIEAPNIPVDECIATPMDMTAKNFPKSSKDGYHPAISAIH